MGYPETINDLPEEISSEGVEVVTWNAERLMAVPQVAQHIAQAALAAEQHGLTISGTCITQGPTEKDLEGRLEGLQSAYTDGENLYEVLRTGERMEAPDLVEMYAINVYLRCNDLTWEDLLSEREQYLENLFTETPPEPEPTPEPEEGESVTPDDGGLGDLGPLTNDDFPKEENPDGV